MAELGNQVRERYAQALFDAAIEENCLDEVESQLMELDSILSSAPDYIKTLSAPVVDNEKKHEMLSKLAECGMHPFLKNVMFILADNGRFFEFHGMCEAFLRLFDKHNNRMRVKAITAFALSPELEEKLKAKLSSICKKEIILQNVIDPSILGGITLQYDNTEVDASVKSSLGAMKRRIKENAPLA